MYGDEGPHCSSSPRKKNVNSLLHCRLCVCLSFNRFCPEWHILVVSDGKRSAEEVKEKQGEKLFFAKKKFAQTLGHRNLQMQHHQPLHSTYYIVVDQPNCGHHRRRRLRLRHKVITAVRQCFCCLFVYSLQTIPLHAVHTASEQLAGLSSLPLRPAQPVQ